MKPPPRGKAGAALTRTYELHRQTGGRWVLDSVADDKDVALAMAKALLTSARPPAEVRIAAVETRADGAFSDMTIFRATPQQLRLATAKAQQPERPGTPPRVPRGKDPRPAASHRALRPRDRKATSLAVKASLASISPRGWLLVCGFIAAWCAIFYVWHQPQTEWAFDTPAAQTTVKQRLPLP
jgi:hypothetical protein